MTSWCPGLRIRCGAFPGLRLRRFDAQSWGSVFCHEYRKFQPNQSSHSRMMRLPTNSISQTFCPNNKMLNIHLCIEANKPATFTRCQLADCCNPHGLTAADCRLTASHRLNNSRQVRFHSTRLPLRSSHTAANAASGPGRGRDE